MFCSNFNRLAMISGKSSTAIFRTAEYGNTYQLRVMIFSEECVYITEFPYFSIWQDDKSILSLFIVLFSIITFVFKYNVQVTFIGFRFTRP